MALASVAKIVDLTRRRKRISISITPSGNYVQGGDTLDLTRVANPSFLSGAAFGTVPQEYEADNAPAGFTAEFIPGATLQTCKVKYNSSDGNELAAAAYPATLIADPTLITLTSKLWIF